MDAKQEGTAAPEGTPRPIPARPSSRISNLSESSRFTYSRQLTCDSRIPEETHKRLSDAKNELERAKTELQILKDSGDATKEQLAAATRRELEARVEVQSARDARDAARRAALRAIEQEEQVRVFQDSPPRGMEHIFAEWPRSTPARAESPFSRVPNVEMESEVGTNIRDDTDKNPRVNIPKRNATSGTHTASTVPNVTIPSEHDNNDNPSHESASRAPSMSDVASATPELTRYIKLAFKDIRCGRLEEESEEQYRERKTVYELMKKTKGHVPQDIDKDKSIYQRAIAQVIRELHMTRYNRSKVKEQHILCWRSKYKIFYARDLLGRQETVVLPPIGHADYPMMERLYYKETQAPQVSSNPRSHHEIRSRVPRPVQASGQSASARPRTRSQPAEEFSARRARERTRTTSRGDGPNDPDSNDSSDEDDDGWSRGLPSGAGGNGGNRNGRRPPGGNGDRRARDNNRNSQGCRESLFSSASRGGRGVPPGGPPSDDDPSNDSGDDMDKDDLQPWMKRKRATRISTPFGALVNDATPMNLPELFEYNPPHRGTVTDHKAKAFEILSDMIYYALHTKRAPVKDSKLLRIMSHSLPQMKKYSGEGSLLTLYEFTHAFVLNCELMGLTGPATIEDEDGFTILTSEDSLRTAYLGAQLDGAAESWFNLQVRRAPVQFRKDKNPEDYRYTFLNVFRGLFDRFINSAAVYEIEEAFYSVQYTEEEGIRGLFQQLCDYAYLMTEPPTTIQFKSTIMAKVPRTFARKALDDKITPQNSSVNVIINRIIDFEDSRKGEEFLVEYAHTIGQLHDRSGMANGLQEAQELDEWAEGTLQSQLLPSPAGSRESASVNHETDAERLAVPRDATNPDTSTTTRPEAPVSNISSTIMMDANHRPKDGSATKTQAEAMPTMKMQTTMNNRS